MISQLHGTSGPIEGLMVKEGIPSLLTIADVIIKASAGGVGSISLNLKYCKISPFIGDGQDVS